MAEKTAFVTLVMCGDKYIPGALVLGWSLKQHASKNVELVVFVTPCVSANGKLALQEVFDQVKEVESIQAEGGQEAVAQTSTQWKRFRHMYDGWLGQCFTKFHVFGLVEYDKVIWLDADMLALRSPDELSLIEAPAGICSLFEAEDAAGNARHGELISKAEIRKSVADGWGMRGCLYVLKPSLKDLEELTAKIASLVPGTAGYIGPDERLTSEHFLAGAGWKHSQWRHVHHRFGCRAWNTSEQIGEQQPVILHFVSEKPWLSETWYSDFDCWAATLQDLLKAKPGVRDVMQAQIPEKAVARKYL